MTSKDDDTLPLPELSQEFSANATVDEDFIPTSQPQSSENSKSSKNSENCFNETTEGLKCRISDSKIDDTLPPEAVMNQSVCDRDKSADFIPDTETKKGQTSYANPEPSCRKKLPVFGTEDIFKLQSNPLWDADASKIPESPALETQNISILNDTSTNLLPSNHEAAGKCEESVTEIIVNDSAETVDLDATPLKIKTADSERILDKSEISHSSNSYGDKCEETQIFDNSSVLLLEQSRAVGSDLEKSERISGVTSEKLYLQETVDDNEFKLKEKMNGYGCASSPPFAVADVSADADPAGIAEEIRSRSVFPKQEVQQNAESLDSNSCVVTRKIDFNLTVSCFVTVDTKTNKVLQKIILNVNETPKPKPKPVYVEAASDNASDKSKRYSTSSSGSVYSEKMGPFALPKRVSAVSDQTDSSEDEIGSLRIRERRALERVPWSNEYLLPLKMDDIMLVTIENQELHKRPNITSPKKLKHKHCNGVSHLKEILESSASEQVSHCNSGELQSNETSPRKLTNSEETLGKETPESSEPRVLEEEKEDPEETEKAVSPQKQEEKEEENREEERKEVSESRETEVERRVDEGGSVKLSEGLPVFARWTDKRYYPGVLSGSLMNERWEVKFDDGTWKTVKEDFVMPAEWLKVGSLVFAMTDDKYESGQIVDIRKGEETDYVVELDMEKKEISVRISDLCLTDVMAGIVREKYKPLVGTPRTKTGIDFDNVLSGKRLREQRTPLRPPSALPPFAGSSGPKKKSSSKPKKEDGLRPIKETPKDEDAGRKMRALRTENGHLVEDKVISADSPSGTETVETPLRKSGKDARKKAKPRSLSYEVEETRSGKKNSKSWLAADGTPIPGPSGVKFKKQKTKLKAEESSDKETESPAAASKSSKKSPTKNMPSTEKSKRKRKLDENVEDCVQKKPLKEENRMKTRTRRG